MAEPRRAVVGISGDAMTHARAAGLALIVGVLGTAMALLVVRIDIFVLGAIRGSEDALERWAEAVGATDLSLWYVERQLLSLFLGVVTIGAVRAVLEPSARRKRVEQTDRPVAQEAGRNG